MSLMVNVTAVAIGQRGVLIEGPPGSGKSSLALALIDRGAMLIGDDGLTVRKVGQKLVAAAPPNVEGLLEVRNVGLLTYPVSPPVPLCLILRLDPAAPRFIDAPERVAIDGVTLPLIHLWPDSPALPLRAEAGLRSWGLDG